MDYGLWTMSNFRLWAAAVAAAAADVSVRSKYFFDRFRYGMCCDDMR